MTAHAKGCRDQFRAWRLICSCRISPNLSRRTSLFLALPRTSRDGKPIFAVFDGPSLRFRAHVDLDQSQSQHRDAYLSMSIKWPHILARAQRVDAQERYRGHPCTSDGLWILWTFGSSPAGVWSLYGDARRF